MPLGHIALVGSGEYTPAMLEIERNLLLAGNKNGKTGGYIQFATAAGLESEDRIDYWRRMGEEQAARIGIEHKFIEVFNREDALDPRWQKEISGASLIYFSGGNPNHVSEVFNGTDLWSAILKEVATGSSLAGCSAGAMMMGSELAFPIRNRSEVSSALGLINNLMVLPHFDRYFGKIPDLLKGLLFKANENTTVLGIDEYTALIFKDTNWICEGRGGIHRIAPKPRESYGSGELVNELPRVEIRYQ